MGTAPNRVPGISTHIPFIYGSVATPIDAKTNDAHAENASGQHTHSWRVFVRGVAGFDLSRVVKRVTFKLHESFVNSTRVVEHAPFEVCETGWGEFEIAIKVHFVDEAHEKPQAFSHFLRLYPVVAAGCSTEGTSSADGSVIFERYDEFIFIEPTDAFYATLQEARDWHAQNAQDLAQCEPRLHEEMLAERQTLNDAIGLMKNQLGVAA